MQLLKSKAERNISRDVSAIKKNCLGLTASTFFLAETPLDIAQASVISS
jgi:hypothetical protein